MAVVTSVRGLGNQLVVYFDDGSQLMCAPTGHNLWMSTTVTGTPTGGGGETKAYGGTPSNPAGTVTAPVDDYPWPDAPQEDMSPLRYSYRDCVDFVAWRINRDNGCTAAPWKYTWGNLRITNGDAIGWYDDWKTHGWGVDITPKPGCIAYYGSTVGQYGHVAYVQNVNADAGTVFLEEYNWGDTQAYDTRTAPISSVTSFLQIPGN